VTAQGRIGSLLHSDPAIGNLNLSGYSNPEADAIIEQAAVTTDDAERLTLLFEIQEILARDLPLITLFYEDGIFAYRPAVFDDWTFMAGQGIINKHSFVTE
jgi:peptide/nickel transport system substrate-binding protein